MDIEEQLEIANIEEPVPIIRTEDTRLCHRMNCPVSEVNLCRDVCIGQIDLADIAQPEEKFIPEGTLIDRIKIYEVMGK